MRRKRGKGLRLGFEQTGPGRQQPMEQKEEHHTLGCKRRALCQHPQLIPLFTPGPLCSCPRLLPPLADPDANFPNPQQLQTLTAPIPDALEAQCPKPSVYILKWPTFYIWAPDLNSGPYACRTRYLIPQATSLACSHIYVFLHLVCVRCHVCL